MPLRCNGTRPTPGYRARERLSSGPGVTGSGGELEELDAECEPDWVNVGDVWVGEGGVGMIP